MTTIGLTGFELNVISATADGSITGTASFQTDIKRTGDYALRCNPVTTAVGYDTISADAATIYPRFYMRIVTLPSANNEEIFVARSAAAQKFAVRIRFAQDCSKTHWQKAAALVLADRASDRMR